MNPIEEFKQERVERIKEQGQNKELAQAASDFTELSMRSKYSYNFSWMGRPIIQYPQDMVAMQELIWEVQPDLIIETGIAHGGSLIYYASLLELIGNDSHIVGVDIDIREHNRKEIEAHPMFKRIELIQGSSLDKDIVAQVAKHTEGKKRILVTLDSNHTHAHVLEELRLYSPFVTQDSYLVVFDTSIEFAADDLNNDRPWGVGDNPKTAVDAFMKENDRFRIMTEVDDKLLISMSPSGYLKCVKG